MMTIYLIRFNTLSGEEARIESSKSTQTVLAGYSKIYEKEIRQRIMSIVSQVYYNAHKFLLFHTELGFLAIGELPQVALAEIQNMYLERVKALLEFIDKKIGVVIEEEGKELYRQIKAKIEMKLAKPFINIYKFEADEETAKKIVDELIEQYTKMAEKYGARGKGREKMMFMWSKQKLEYLNQLKFINATS